MSLFPNRSSLNFRSIDTTTFGEIAVTTKLKKIQMQFKLLSHHEYKYNEYSLSQVDEHSFLDLHSLLRGFYNFFLNLNLLYLL
jgi:hypothetical protein